MNQTTTSLETFHEKQDMDSYLECQSMNSFQCYTRSLEQRTSDSLTTFGRYNTSYESPTMFNTYEEHMERRKNLKLLEFMELEQEELPFISPYSHSEADEIKAESMFFDQNTKLNKIPEPDPKNKSIDKNNLFRADTLIDTAIHGSTREKEAIIENMKDFLGIEDHEGLESNEPVMSRNKYRTAVIDIGGTHYRSKVTSFKIRKNIQSQ